MSKETNRVRNSAKEVYNKIQDIRMRGKQSTSLDSQKNVMERLATLQKQLNDYQGPVEAKTVATRIKRQLDGIFGDYKKTDGRIKDVIAQWDRRGGQNFEQSVEESLKLLGQYQNKTNDKLNEKQQSSLENATQKVVRSINKITNGFYSGYEYNEEVGLNKALDLKFHVSQGKIKELLELDQKTKNLIQQLNVFKDLAIDNKTLKLIEDGMSAIQKLHASLGKYMDEEKPSPTNTNKETTYKNEQDLYISNVKVMYSRQVTALEKIKNIVQEAGITEIAKAANLTNSEKKYLSQILLPEDNNIIMGEYTQEETKIFKQTVKISMNIGVETPEQRVLLNEALNILGDDKRKLLSQTKFTSEQQEKLQAVFNGENQAKDFEKIVSILNVGKELDQNEQRLLTMQMDILTDKIKKEILEQRKNSYNNTITEKLKLTPKQSNFLSETLSFIEQEDITKLLKAEIPDEISQELQKILLSQKDDSRIKLGLQSAIMLINHDPQISPDEFSGIIQNNIIEQSALLDIKNISDRFGLTQEQSKLLPAALDLMDSQDIDQILKMNVTAEMKEKLAADLQNLDNNLAISLISIVDKDIENKLLSMHKEILQSPYSDRRATLEPNSINNEAKRIAELKLKTFLELERIEDIESARKDVQNLSDPPQDWSNLNYILAQMEKSKQYIVQSAVAELNNISAELGSVKASTPTRKPITLGDLELAKEIGLDLAGINASAIPERPAPRDIRRNDGLGGGNANNPIPFSPIPLPEVTELPVIRLSNPEIDNLTDLLKHKGQIVRIVVLNNNNNNNNPPSYADISQDGKSITLSDQSIQLSPGLQGQINLNYDPLVYQKSLVEVKGLDNSQASPGSDINSSTPSRSGPIKPTEPRPSINLDPKVPAAPEQDILTDFRKVLEKHKKVVGPLIYKNIQIELDAFSESDFKDKAKIQEISKDIQQNIGRQKGKGIFQKTIEVATSFVAWQTAKIFSQKEPDKIKEAKAKYDHKWLRLVDYKNEELSQSASLINTSLKNVGELAKKVGNDVAPDDSRNQPQSSESKNADLQIQTPIRGIMGSNGPHNNPSTQKLDKQVGDAAKARSTSRADSVKNRNKSNSPGPGR